MAEENEDCLRLILAQHGLITRAQAKKAGLSDAAVEWRLKRGRWQRIHQRVYALRGVPRTWHQRLLAACLTTGDEAVVSHSAAAALWGMEGFTRETVVLTIPPHYRPRDLEGVSFHRAANLLQEETVTSAGIPVTSAAQTLLDLAASEPEEQVECALEQSFRRRWTRKEDLEALIGRQARGVRSAATIRELLRMHGRGLTESALEVKMLRLFRRSFLPQPYLQHEVWNGSEFIARVDFAYPLLKVAVETDGRSVHERRQRFHPDHQRRNRLQALGWRVLVFTHEALRKPREVEASIGETLNAATL